MLTSILLYILVGIIYVFFDEETHETISEMLELDEGYTLVGSYLVAILIWPITIILDVIYWLRNNAP